MVSNIGNSQINDLLGRGQPLPVFGGISVILKTPTKPKCGTGIAIADDCASWHTFFGKLPCQSCKMLGQTVSIALYAMTPGSSPVTMVAVEGRVQLPLT